MGLINQIGASKIVLEGLTAQDISFEFEYSVGEFSEPVLIGDTYHSAATIRGDAFIVVNATGASINIGEFGAGISREYLRSIENTDPSETFYWEYSSGGGILGGTSVEGVCPSLANVSPVTCKVGLPRKLL